MVWFFIVGPKKIKKCFLGCRLFYKYIINQWLKIDLQTILDLLNMMDGLDHDCVTHTVGFQSQKCDQGIIVSE